MPANKTIIVSVTTDLSTDQRVQKIASSLSTNGFAVTLVGRKRNSSLNFAPKDYHQKRFNLLFDSGFLFYACFNIRLFFYLLFNKVDILYANDLDTLPANFLVSKLKKVPLVYDSHEYFTEVPELIHRKRVKAFWESIESYILPKLDYCITVGEMIAKEYAQKYKKEFLVVRNFPIKNKKSHTSKKKRQIIYQGALNVGRGIEHVIQAMTFVDEAVFLIAGNGDIKEELVSLRNKLELQEKVKFLGRLSPQELIKHTQASLLGVSLEEKLGKNYTYALPNKLFDYLNTRTPILYSDLIEFKKLIGKVEIGEELKSRDPEAMGNQINEMLDSKKLDLWSENCSALAERFTWRNEEVKLIQLINKASQRA